MERFFYLKKISKMTKHTKKTAQKHLYNLWENGEIPRNFTEDHSEYSTAIQHLLKFGYVIWEDLI